MWSCERGNRSRKRLESVTGERRLPISQVLLDASKSALPFLCIAVRVPPWSRWYCVSPAVSEGTFPSEVASATAQLLKKPEAQRFLAQATSHCQSDPWQPKTNASLQPSSRAGSCPSYLPALAEETQRKETP